MFRTAFVLGECGQRNLQAVAQFQVIGTRVGRGTLAYQVQEAIPDRHARDYSRTSVLWSSKLQFLLTEKLASNRICWADCSSRKIDILRSEPSELQCLEAKDERESNAKTWQAQSCYS